jgi:hypothetical protein
MSVLTGTIDGGRALLSSTLIKFCAKVRDDDLLLEPSMPFLTLVKADMTMYRSVYRRVLSNCEVKRRFVVS